MIYSMLESSIRTAINNPDNLNEDGSINWNFVDTDAYAECVQFFKDAETFYEMFDEIVTAIIVDDEEVIVDKQTEMAF